ncbi:MAG TPA: hypothetical protein VD970_15315, partial [Acetobacteraceae bacterium]|nr:hypothetical protein [Acetobacteraceae bacterium]
RPDQAAAAEGAPAAPPEEAMAAPAREERRPDRPNPPRHGGKPQPGQRPQEGGPPPFRGNRDRERGRSERAALPPMPKPDSPFAVLAQLKLKP